MRAAASIPDFVKRPVGAYFAGGTYLVWCHDHTLDGIALWGQPAEADLASITRLWAQERRVARAEAKDVISDARGLERVDRASFRHLAAYLDREHGHLQTRIRRHVVLHSKDLAGAFVAGLPRIVSGAEAWRVFTDVPPALDWLGRGDARAVFAQVERLVAKARTLAPLLTRLRAHLRASPAEPTLPSVARALAVAPRTLQRVLDEEHTTFRQERDQAWLETVTRYLADDASLKLEALARLVGCATATSFSKRFRRLAGKTPSAAREELW